MTTDIKTIENTIFSKSFYSWSASEIMGLSRKILKNQSEILTNHPELVQKRIAICGTCNIRFISSGLIPFLMAEGIFPLIFEGKFNGLSSEILSSDSDLYAFDPDYLITITDYRDIHEFPPYLTSLEKVREMADRQIEEWVHFWEYFHQRCKSKVFLTNIAISNRHILGGLEANLASGRDVFLRILNLTFLEKKPTFLTFLDQEALSADFGKDRWFDDSEWFISKQPFALEAIPIFSLAIAKQIAADIGKIRKCLITDLDNTLWGGILGDDGINGINLDPNDPIGESFLDFQKTLKLYKDRGVLLAVCSKNDPSIAKEVFQKHPNCILKTEDFSAFIADWEDKPINIQKIASQLNIGLDSLVFFDDNPAERDLVKKVLPMVQVIDVPEDPAEFSMALIRSHCFDWGQLTEEDLNRSETIRADRKRSELGAITLNYEDYLKALEMRISIAKALPHELNRFTQLINKTNQFNLRTRRYNESEITATATDPDKVLLRVTLQDKFSDYGIISAIILNLDHSRKNILIDTWVMSCRVFKRGIEDEVMNYLIAFAKDNGFQTVEGEYICNPRNGLVADLYTRYGFKMVQQNDISKKYILNINDYVPYETWFNFELKGKES